MQWQNKFESFRTLRRKMEEPTSTSRRGDLMFCDARNGLRANCIAAHPVLYCGVSAEETKQFWKYRKEALWSAMSQYPDRDPMV